MGLFGAPRRARLPEPNVFGDARSDTLVAQPPVADVEVEADAGNASAASSAGRAFGQPSLSEIAVGQQAVAQPCVGQPAFDQPAFGQPSLDQVVAAFGQPAFGEAAFGQPSFAPEPSVPAATQDWRMPAPEVPNRVEVQVLGNGFQVNGVLATGRFERLSDWLNMQQGWVHMKDGVLSRPGEDGEGSSKPKSDQWVRLNEVVLVAEHRAVPRDRGNTPGYVRKERRKVTVVTHGYTLRGHIHLVESGTMESFLDTHDPRFIPMTDVVVRWLADEQLVSHLPFALVNRGQLISVSEEAPRPELDGETAEPTAEQGEAPAAFLRTA